MKLHRIYQQQKLDIEQTVILSPEAANHVAVVLHMRPKEQLILFNGDSFEYYGIITSVNKKEVSVFITNKEKNIAESKHNIHLAQAIIKGDRMELIIQKAVELGVKSITPVITDRCVVRIDHDRLEKKHKQWQMIAIAACEQSGRNVIPEIHPPCELSKHINSCNTHLKIMLHPENENLETLTTEAERDSTIIIGPEGGFTDKEVDIARDKGFHIVKLGNRILRAETAAIAAIIYLQIKVGDL